LNQNLARRYEILPNTGLSVHSDANGLAHLVYSDQDTKTPLTPENIGMLVAFITKPANQRRWCAVGPTPEAKKENECTT
jgi:hypothetical protein